MKERESVTILRARPDLYGKQVFTVQICKRTGHFFSTVQISTIYTLQL